MTLQYKDYTIIGTIEEILEFIKTNETINIVYSFDLDEKPNQCEPNVDEAICDKRCKMTFDKEYVEKHFDFFSKYSYVYDAYKKIYRFYLKEGKEHQSFIEGCRNLE